VTALVIIKVIATVAQKNAEVRSLILNDATSRSEVHLSP
jgi:hypothetical protein